ncbi:MAG TPA: sulfite exporter TauE/SafE family protein [Opitutales bacterium]|nr:sulfite exporter TauE/SafE family protein [Opitutales bacterium]
MQSLEVWQYLLIAAGAFAVGLGKGGLPGVGNVTVVLMALALPAKASVGVLLPILISADIVAVIVYRRHAHWSYIVKLAPWTIAGILLGYLVFSHVDDRAVRILIGSVLLSMTGIHFLRKWLRRSSQGEDRLPHHPAFVGATGITGGFATMIANAAGPVAALYFIASGLPKYAYIGTSAWFFFLVNVFKVPFMMDLGIIHLDSLGLSASFMIYSVLGALTGPRIVKHINQRIFELLIWVFVVIGGLKLIIP